MSLILCPSIPFALFQIPLPILPSARYYTGLPVPRICLSPFLPNFLIGIRCVTVTDP